MDALCKKHRYRNSMKPGTPVLRSTRLLDQVRERVRYRHYSLSTEKAYLYWVRFFIRWHGRAGGVRHPRDMGAPEMEALLTMLAIECRVSPSTHNQALSALLFLSREVLSIDLPWLDGVSRPAQKRRIPSVLTKEEVTALFQFLSSDLRLLAQLLHGTGMRLMEGLRLRIKDVDFDRHMIIVREAKGNKDRVVMLPRALPPALRKQLLHARHVWEEDRQAQRGGVQTPHALEQKYPRVGSTWGWFWFSFHHPLSPSTRTQALNVAITCLKSGCNAQSRGPWPRRAFASPFLCIPCATALPRTCCNLAPISARCRSFSATAMCRPP